MLELRVASNVNKTVEITRIDVDNNAYANAIKILHPSVVPHEGGALVDLFREMNTLPLQGHCTRLAALTTAI